MEKYSNKRRHKTEKIKVRIRLLFSKKDNDVEHQFDTGVVAEIDDFIDLENEWNDLFFRSRCDNPFLSYDWMATWWSCWGEQHRLFVITTRDLEGRLVALAPFLSVKPFNKLLPKFVCFMADTYVGSDHLNILVEPGLELVVTGELARELVKNRKKWDYIRLKNCAAKTDVLSGFIDALKREGMRSKVVTRFICPSIELPLSFEVYLSKLSKKMRYNFRRSSRVLDRELKSELICSQNGEELEKALVDLIRLHAGRSEQLNRKSSFLPKKTQEFHGRVVREMSKHGWPRIYTLSTEHEVVASLYGFLIGKKFMFYQCGFDPKWSHYGVGTLLIGYTIRDAIEQGCGEYDFLRGDEPYKWRWAKECKEDFTVFLSDGRLRSQLARLLLEIDLMLDSIKKLVRVLFIWLKRWQFGRKLSLESILARLKR